MSEIKHEIVEMVGVLSRLVLSQFEGLAFQRG